MIVVAPPQPAFAPAVSTAPVVSAAPTVRRLGRIGYREAWSLQRRLVAARRGDEVPDTLLLLEHPPVITLGRAGSTDHLLGSESELEGRGVELVASDRGGDITFHGPGQIVGYAIVDLKARGRDLHRYLRDLESVLIRALEEFGIRAGRAPGLTGVWVGDAKVAAIGIRVSRWIAHHGFALNVATDLSYFDLIVPCGVADRRVTSMEALLGGPVDRAAVEVALASAFREVFHEAEGCAEGESPR
jgi:lipoate-protein ligase B